MWSFSIKILNIISMKKNKIITLFFCLLISSFASFAQQEHQLSTYFFNPLVINSAYAGSQKSMVINATVRDQWTNFKGAPKSQVITLHSPLKKENIGVGFTLINDKLGAHSNKSLMLDFSVGVKLNKKDHHLALGIKSGVDVYQTNYNGLRIQDNTDGIYNNGFNYTKVLPNVGAGLYYYGNRFYLGASSPKLVKNNFSSVNGQKSVQENHFYFFGGYVVKLNSTLSMRPSFIVKYVNNAPLSVDGNLSFLIFGKVWLGAMYRNKSAVGLNCMYYLTESFNVGYAYDYTLNAIQNYSSGSHEIMLSYKFKSKSKGYMSPRYF